MTYFKDCTKCGGSGKFPLRSGAYGKCFACRGFGRSFKSKAARVAYYAEKEKKAEEFLAESGKFLVGVSFFYAATGHPIARSVLEWAKKGRAPSPKMLSAVYGGVCRLLAKLEAGPEETAPVIEGKGVTLEGEVLSVKWREGRWGGAMKMLLKEARGFKVWGTVPAAIVETTERGSKVRFVANTTASDDDECFGFFSRPRKAELLAA